MNVPAELALGQKPSLREAGLWTAAAVSVVLAHVAVSFAFQSMQEQPEAFSTEEAMVIELEPVAFTSAASVAPSEVITEEDVEAIALDEVAEIEPEEPAEAVAEAPVESPIAEEAGPEVVRDETPAPVEQEPVEQEVAEAAEPEVVIPLPRPERVVEETPPERVVAEAPPEKPRKEVEKKREKTAEKKPERRKADTPKPVKTADVRTEAKSRSSSQVEQQAASTSRASLNQWNNAVQRAIARRARGARGTRGNVSIAFVVSSSGAISSARVAQSSGNSRLDSTALNIVRSARVPAPPPDLSGSHAFTIPMTFR